MKIVIKTIPHDQHRYPTIGDWWTEADGTLQVRVSEFADNPDRMFSRARRHYAILIALHELIEAALCGDRGITQEAVDAFDQAHTADDDPWVNDPGLCPDAPYHKEHVFAECIERLVARELGVDWQDYDAACLALDVQEPPPCERGYSEPHLHPRFPSGYCAVCGAEAHQGCRHELAVGEFAPREDGP